MALHAFPCTNMYRHGREVGINIIWMYWKSCALVLIRFPTKRTLTTMAVVQGFLIRYRRQSLPCLRLEWLKRHLRKRRKHALASVSVWMRLRFITFLFMSTPTDGNIHHGMTHYTSIACIDIPHQQFMLMSIMAVSKIVVCSYMKPAANKASIQLQYIIACSLREHVFF